MGKKKVKAGDSICLIDPALRGIVYSVDPNHPEFFTAMVEGYATPQCLTRKDVFMRGDRVVCFNGDGRVNKSLGDIVCTFYDMTTHNPANKKKYTVQVAGTEEVNYQYNVKHWIKPEKQAGNASRTPISIINNSGTSITVTTTKIDDGSFVEIFIGTKGE